MRHYNEEHIKAIEGYVNKCRLEHNTAPTIVEIAGAVGIPVSTVSRYLKKMSSDGILTNAASRRMETRLSTKGSNTVPVPLLGRISCGPLKDAVENIEEYIRIPRSWCGPGEFFALRANGDSMIGAGISSGDIVIVKHQNTAETGQIIVALVDSGEATLKRYHPHPDDGTVDLVPENSEYKPLTVDLTIQTLTIQGIAVKVVKDLI